jgi:hypothetical protein
MLLLKTSRKTYIRKCKRNKNNKMNGILLEGEALSRCGKSLLAMIDNEASFERIVDDLQQLEEEAQVGRAEQQGVICLAKLSDAEFGRRIGGLRGRC